MSSKGTPHRTIRVDDDLWWPARTKAESEGIHLSDIIRDALRAYLERPTSEPNHSTD